MLRAQIDTVVDAAALRRDERAALRAIATDEDARFALVECSAPEPVLRARIARRLQADRDASDADDAVLDLQLRVREPVAAQERALTLPTDCDPAALRQRCASLAARFATPPAALAQDSPHDTRP